MSSSYKLQIPDGILKKIKKTGNQALIAKIKSLAINPLAYGEPLRENLKGFYKAKVPPFRLIYMVDPENKS